MPEDAAPLSIQVEVPPELEQGVYANFAVVNHTEHDFTLDFCLVFPPHEEGASATLRVVSRVRIAHSLVGPLLQAISQNAFTREERLRQAHEEGEDRPDI